MRRDRGFYPAFFADQTMVPRESPDAWLTANEDGSIVVGEAAEIPMRPEPGQVEIHAIGDVVAFDYYEAIGVDIVEFTEDGFRLQGGGNWPSDFDTCWNPADATAAGYETLGAFAAGWREGGRPVAVEFVKWTRGIPYRLETGPSAVLV
jgi:hypothetical protein